LASTPRILRFPKGFLWGTASAAHQVEGGTTNNQWYRWEQQGHILSGDTCGNACDWWQRAEQDFALAEQMENNALRLSLEWSRLEPTEGHWDSAAFDRYRAMLGNLRRRQMTPIVALHHFTEPLWFAVRGGFAVATNRRYFVRFVQQVVRQLGDLCDFWITFNEPNTYAAMGYAFGIFPPGQRSLAAAYRVIHNILQAHVEAFYAITELQPVARVGYCLQYRLFDPLRVRHPLDRATAYVREHTFNWALLNAAEHGHFSFPLNFVLEPLKRAPGTRDYHGVNYYTRELVRFDPGKPGELFGRHYTRKGAVANDSGLAGEFGEIYPDGLYRVLKAVHHYARGNKPLYVTENGFNDVRDDRRPRALLEHLVALHRALREGVPVRGYLHWSLLDNFEWVEGWGAHFGLLALDPKTQKREPRASASLFGEICRANAITADIVERYAPEAMDAIFGMATADVPLNVQVGKRVNG
jgi:beta-glucosidase